ncbi:imidazole glycerol phosphate synthase cyclase subunit [Pelagibacterales bacterium]|nr:imidazole glycerol phosphate synthase cyclase subunit [Pelagibacterales bacterium]
MLKTRLIARLDIKGPNLIKSIRFEGLRVLGNPHEFAKKYYDDGIDEIIYVDTVATLYERVGIHNLLKETVKDTFIPITAAGGIRSIEDVDSLLRSGADKVAINTAAVRNPQLITQVSNKFGSQCTVISIEACKQSNGQWEVYTDNGRERTGIDVVEWSKKVSNIGAGEILLTSVDQDGTQKGFDGELIHSVSSSVPIPVIASGGFGRPSDFEVAVNQYSADAVAVGSSLHYSEVTIKEIKDYSKKKSILVR